MKVLVERGPPYVFLRCRACRDWFAVSRSAFRGHRYCEVSCRRLGYARAHRAAQRRYQATEVGRIKNAVRSRMYRQRDRGSASVTDKGSKQGEREISMGDVAREVSPDITVASALRTDPLRSAKAGLCFSGVPSKFSSKEAALAHLADGLAVCCHVSGELLEGECLGFFDAASDEDWEKLQEILLETPHQT